MKKGEERKDGMRNVYALGAVSFLTDVSSEMIFSVLPSFVVQVIGASKTELGIIEGIGESSSYLLRIISGYISDRVGKRKPLVLLGYGLSTLAKPLFYFASNWIDVLLVRLTDRIGKAVRTAPRDSLLSASAPSESLGKAFGIHRALDQSGAILGPILAILLLPLLSFKGLFVFSFVPGLLVVLVLIFLVQEVAVTTSSGTPLRNFREALSPSFARFLAVVAIFSIGAFDFSFILVRAGDVGISEQFVPAVYMLINISHTLIAIPAGSLSDRIGKGRVLAAGYVLLAVTNSVLVFLPQSVLQVLVAAGLFGLYFGVTETVQRAIIPGYASQSLRGTAYGIYYLDVGICYLFANVVVGYLWDSIGPTAAFTYSLSTSLLAAAGMLVLIAPSRPTH